MRVGFAAIDDIAEFNAAGICVKSSDEITPDALKAIAEVRHGADGSVHVRMHDKLRALEKLGRHLGLFRHEVAMSGNIEHGVRDDPRSAHDILLARVQAILARREANDGLDPPDATIG
jgi:phage terminase small subunit